eukprot:CAMPEP_0194259504 /NCGR_PEP_ID=MMETSP0158-20130606/43729_1 /TAXON_ID=33649 /ORGANISM="Thalassionema nitzschioides, Strain L26-B" /LENGTH=260 /DNA_ID=CAMNT_0038999323 /DNA_START=100 /DNA_END=879 /DNA_ORIENTATION=+
MMVFWLTLVDLQTSSSSYSLRTLSLLARRPTIYTSTTSENTNDSWYLLWDAAWRAAGFRTKLIRIEDVARGHSKFDLFAKELSSSSPSSNNDDKENIRFEMYRYLAMSQMGGGIYVDVNVFPLWPLTYDIKRELADPKFTVRCGSISKPSGCFSSGSKDEWDRIAMDMLTIYQEQEYSGALSPQKALFTVDMALQDITSFAKGHPSAQQESQVLSTEQAHEFDFRNIRMSQCQTPKLAVKFHNADNNDDATSTTDTVKEW